MIHYYNRNTGQVVDREGTDLELEALDNWRQVDDPDEARTWGATLDDGVLRRKGMGAATSTNGSADTTLTGGNLVQPYPADIPSDQVVNTGGQTPGAENVGGSPDPTVVPGDPTAPGGANGTGTPGSADTGDPGHVDAVTGDADEKGEHAKAQPRGGRRNASK